MGREAATTSLTELQSRLIKILADGSFHSGARLGQELGVSRAAVWQYISHLRGYGLDIDTVKGRGYRLSVPLQLLDIDKILSQLTSEQRHKLGSLHLLQVVDSTNAYLLRCTGAPVACLAEYQTAGRGRRGRQWFSPFGTNIYLSLRWRFEDGMGQLSGLSLAAGVAVLRALSSLGITDAGLKWPNDIYWAGRKLGGILLEVTGESAGPCNVIIGVGLNVHMPARLGSAIDQPWISLDAMYSDIERNALAASLLGKLLDVLVVFEQNGLLPFAQEWRRADVYAGQPVNLVLPGETLQGVCRGIDHDGALLLEAHGEIQRFTYGEVSVRPAGIGQ